MRLAWTASDRPLSCIPRSTSSTGHVPAWKCCPERDRCPHLREAWSLPASVLSPPRTHAEVDCTTDACAGLSTYQSADGSIPATVSVGTRLHARTGLDLCKVLLAIDYGTRIPMPRLVEAASRRYDGLSLLDQSEGASFQSDMETLVCCLR